MAQLDKSVLERYVQLDKLIHEEESKNNVKALSVKEEQLKDLQQTVNQLQSHYDKCVKQTEKEKKDVDQLTNVRQMFESQSVFDQKMTKEQEEYMDALNKQEVAKREVDGVTEQTAEVQKAVEKLKTEVDQLNNLYKEYDDLMDSIFKGAYGSDEENKLEKELDQLLDKKQRIQVASYKWTNGRTLLNHALAQMNVVDKKWNGEIPKQNDSRKKYEMATECRNNCIAASQNMTSTHQYLSNITFPYCTSPEVETLLRAVEHIYTDLLTPDRHAHAGNVYCVTRKRLAALLQWFDNVITNTIERDFDKAKKEANVKEIELRKERLRLIKAKIGEESGDTNVSVKGEMELGKDAKKESTEEYISKPEPGTKSAPAAAAAVPLSQLAPAPSQEQIFGELDSLKKQHERELKEYEKAQGMNKARTEQDLAEKLAARRNRRQRMNAEQQ